LTRIAAAATKSVVSKAPITGRHHPGIPSDMISETVGDIIGIRNRRLGLGRGRQEDLSARVEGAAAVAEDRATAEVKPY